MNKEEFNETLKRFRKKRKFESMIHYSFILGVGVILILQLKGMFLSTFGVTAILVTTNKTIINISSRSSSLYQSMSDYYRLKVPSYAPLQSPALKLSADMERDLGKPIQKEIILNTRLLYTVGFVALVCSFVVIVDVFSGHFHIYQFSPLVNNIVYYSYFALMIVLYRVMFLSEKRICKIHSRFIDYMGMLEKLRVKQTGI